MQRDVLLLNSSEEVIKIIDWKKAIQLLFSGKAIKPINYNKNYKVRTVEGEYELPAAIVLIRYVRLPYGVSPRPTRRNIFKRDNWTCQYCGKKTKNPKSLTIDHVYPKSKGGDSSWTNLTTACQSCNTKKGDKTLKECKMSPLSKPKKPRYYALQITGIDRHGKELWSRWIQI